MSYFVTVRRYIGRPYFVRFSRPEMTWKFIRSACESTNVVSCVLKVEA